MIIEGAIGDAYGAGFEFADYEKITLKNNLTKYEPHPLFLEINGCYTDDTQMSLALSELILSGDEWTSTNIANRFVNTFKRDPRKGYSKLFYEFLMEIESGEQLLQKIINKSERNGAAMRAYVIGVYKSEQEIIKKCKVQAEITHCTENAVMSAQAISLISHFFIYEKGSRTELLEYLNDFQKFKWTGNWIGEVGMSGHETVEAVLSIILKYNKMSEILKSSVDFGGDVDTVASLALAISSLDKTIENNLPMVLYSDLENGQYGKDYLISIDEKLKQLIENNKNT